MTTAIKNARIKQRFEMWDVNGNGRIERSDYEAEANRIIEAFGETPQSAKGRVLLDAYLGMFDHLATKAGVGPNGALTEQQFTEVVESQMFEQGDAGFARVLRPTVSAMVGLADTDGDGQVNPAEFKNWLMAIGVNSVDADDAFRKLDVNGNGELSVDELVNAVRDFHFGKIDVPLLGS